MSKFEMREVARCPKCAERIWSDHPYSWCMKCGEPLPHDIQAQLPALASTQAATAAADAGETLVVAGRQVQCPVCGHDRFWTRQTLMETRGATFFGLEWAGKAATNYICHGCGFVLWFLKK